MAELMAHDPCEDGLTRLTSGLGVYSGPTIITVDDLVSLTVFDLLWCVKLLHVSEHEQKVICVKTALYAANSVAHLTDDPRAAKCRVTSRVWLDNPCEETRKAARTTYYDASAASASAYYAATSASIAATSASIATTSASIASDAAAAADARASAISSSSSISSSAAAVAGAIKAHLIKLIKELDE